MYEMIVGLEVFNNKIYSQYRESMKPLLVLYGGTFRFDFVVSEVLISQVDKPINRIFAINFPDESAAKEFFLNSSYLEAKRLYFDNSVASTTIISEYKN